MQITERQRNYSIALRQINANIYFMFNYGGTEAVQCSSYESKRPLRNGRTETVLEVQDKLQEQGIWLHTGYSFQQRVNPP